MTPERWQHIKRIFQSALDRAPAERPAYLAEACAQDTALQREVETLLSAEGQLGDFITKPVVDEAADFIAAAQGVDRSAIFNETTAGGMTGRRIGNYEIQREIGRGGMGAVYLAERADEQFRQQVAIKVIRRGLDSDFVTNRFRHERQILASFDHPNIARLIDGGTTEDGLLYLVMEYIEGEPLDLYGDRRELGMNERIKLFRQVCAAVHYAHQNLVVHRDLKPGNILVTADGTPKLLDFGIAKLLDPTLYVTFADPTLTGLRLMTPAYASPEQIRGDPITTASDVYSLGVILYELLTGHRPYRIRTLSPGELERAICELEPERPSTAVRRVEDTQARDGSERPVITPEIVSQRRGSHPDKLIRALSGDLDNIALMALRKEPQRRYASAEQLSEDLRRYLEGLPIQAQQDTFRYRAQKFIHRNKAGVAAAALLILSLIGGIITTTWQARVAQAQGARAERLSNDVQRLANTFLFEIHDRIVDLPGSTDARGYVITTAIDYLNRLKAEATNDPALAVDLAVGYLKLGDAQGNPAYANRGQLSPAINSYELSLALLESAVRISPSNARAQRLIGIANERIGDVQMFSGNIDETSKRYGRTLAIREAAVAAKPGDPVALRDISVSYERIGDLRRRTLDTSGALDYFRKGYDVGVKTLEYYRTTLNNALQAVPPPDPQKLSELQNLERVARRDMALGHDRMGDMYVTTGELSRGIEEYRKGQEIRIKLAQENEPSTEYERDYSICLNKIADARLKAGDIMGALEDYDRASQISKKISDADPQNAQAQRDVALSYSLIGQARLLKGLPADALSSLRKAATTFEAQARNAKDAQARSDLALVEDGIGMALAKQGNRAGALAAHERARTLFSELAKEDPTAALAIRDLAMSHNRGGESLILLGDLTGAAAQLEAAIIILAPLVERDGINVETRLQLAKAYHGLGICRAKAGDRANAALQFAQAETHFKQVLAKDDLYYEARQGLGRKQ
jgi:non-specific serine/threonine protein kinase/serine/threonine-protein kinase